MIDRVYLLIGSNRDHDLGDDWIVAAYPEREMAEKHRFLASGYMQLLWAKEDEAIEYDEEARQNCPYDERWSEQQRDYLGYRLPSYRIEEVPFVLHVDQYQEVAPGF